jgi:hypothetical protein
MPLLTRKVVIGIALEVSEGFDPGLDMAQNAILIENPAFTENSIMHERNPVKATLGKTQGVYGGGLYQITFDQEIKGSGSEGVAPECGVPLIVSGMSETIDPGVSVAYQTASDGHQTATIYLYHDGLFTKLTGVKGDFTAALEGIGKFSFTMTGHSVEQGNAQAGGASDITLDARSASVNGACVGQLIKLLTGAGACQEAKIIAYDGTTKVATVDAPWGTPPDATTTYAIDNGPIDRVFPSATYDASVPPPVRNMPVTLGAYGPVISKMSVNMGNAVTAPPSVRSYDGHGAVIINDRDVNGSIDPEATLVATKDWVQEFKKGTNFALDTGVVGCVAGNRYRLQHPGIYYKEPPAKGDLEGKQIYDITYGAVEVVGDDYMVMTFT